jgi:hypothetical protein
MEASGVSTGTANLLELAVSLVAAVFSLCLYVPAVRYRVRIASWSFALSFLAFGAFAAVMLLRLLR